MKTTTRRLAALATLLLAACASLPEGPSEMALPGSGRNFEQFRGDDQNCRQFALQQIGGKTAQQAQVDSALTSAAVGAVVGAVAGGVIDGHRGAGVGAGTGLLFGAMVGSESSGISVYEAQRRYDHAYLQCMYSAGHRIPVRGNFSEPGRQVIAPAPSYPPPPPPPRASPYPPPQPR